MLLSWRRPDASSYGLHFSYAKCKNGKVIVLWGGPTSLIEAFADDVNAFITPGTLLSGHNTIFPSSSHIRGTVYNDVSGDLFLSMTRLRNAASDDYQQCRIYKSPSGNGGDWVLHSIIRDCQITESYMSTSGKEISIGVPFKLPSGRLVISYPHYYVGSSAGRCGCGISTSDDNGLTWTFRISYQVGPAGGYYLENQSRNFGYYKGSLWWACLGSLASGYSYLFSSSDEGITWNVHFNWQTPYLFESADFFSDDNYLWVVGTTRGGVNITYIGASTTPDIKASWHIWDQFSLYLPSRKAAFVKYFNNEGKMVVSAVHRVAVAEVTITPTEPLRISPAPSSLRVLPMYPDVRNSGELWKL